MRLSKKERNRLNYTHIPVLSKNNRKKMSFQDLGKLARRMKQSLLESEEAKQLQQQEDSFSLLDKKLLDVERQRQENHQRELLLQENLRKQQAQMARNIQRSAAQMRNDDC